MMNAKELLEHILFSSFPEPEDTEQSQFVKPKTELINTEDTEDFIAQAIYRGKYNSEYLIQVIKLKEEK